METKMVKTFSAHKISSYKLEGKKEDLRKSTKLWIKRRFNKKTYRTQKKLLNLLFNTEISLGYLL